jgi:uncharacterized protein YndB with AHSA1/START domain
MAVSSSPRSNAMWTHEEAIETSATPQRVWTLFADVANWPRWNAGIEHITLHGAFASGARFSMQLPDGGPSLDSTLAEVEPGSHFTDETQVDGACVRVQHQIIAVRPDCTRIVYRTTVTGPQAEQWGPMVTADFAAVLTALKACAEGEP